ncbi:MAG: MbnP family protein [bacterium]
MTNAFRGRFWMLGSVTLGLVAAGCGSDDKTVSGPQPIEIQFEARVGDEPFACGQRYEGLGTTSSTGEPMDGRFYVSDIHFVNDDESERFVTLEQDGEWQLDDVALLDFEDGTGRCAAEGTAATNTPIRGTVESGHAARIHFTVGVPFALNHGDATTAPAPPTRHRSSGAGTSATSSSRSSSRPPARSTASSSTWAAPAARATARAT